MISKKSVAGNMAGIAGPAEEERVEFIAKSNAAPQSQLYHIARYMYLLVTGSDLINIMRPNFMYVCCHVSLI